MRPIWEEPFDVVLAEHRAEMERRPAKERKTIAEDLTKLGLTADSADALVLAAAITFRQQEGPLDQPLGPLPEGTLRDTFGEHASARQILTRFGLSHERESIWRDANGDLRRVQSLHGDVVVGALPTVAPPDRN